MIPLRDNQPTSSFPIITILIIALNVAVYLQQLAVPGLESSYAMVPYEITHNVNLIGYKIIGSALDPLGPTSHAIKIYYGPGPNPIWLTIFTSMFMHENLLHIGGNMLFLWIFGNNIEDALGKVRFILFYLACGLAAALAQIVSDPNSYIPTLGASGAIAGVLGAYIVLYPDARVLSVVPVFIFFVAEIRAYWFLVLWIALNIWQGLEGWGSQMGGGVAYFAHIGGFFTGVVLIYLLGGHNLVARQRQRVYSNRPPHY